MPEPFPDLSHLTVEQRIAYLHMRIEALDNLFGWELANT
jgi:hypothetical protein